MNTVIACSNNEPSIFKRISQNNMKLIENGINVEKYKRIKHVSCEKKHFITVGSFSQNKQIDLLLELIANFLNDFPDIKL